VSVAAIMSGSEMASPGQATLAAMGLTQVEVDE